MKDDNGYRTDRSEPQANRPMRIGITHGDFNGVGYEVIMRAFDDPRMFEICTPVVYGSAKIAAFYRKGFENTPLPQVNQIQDPSQARAEVINMINVINREAHITPGEGSAEAGEAAVMALERAMADLKAGKIDALVTAPINKASIHSESFPFTGHTEWLQHHAAKIAAEKAPAIGEIQAAQGADGEEFATSPKALMMLCCDGLRVALVTNHLPLAQVASNLTQQLIEDKINALVQALVSDFGIVKPRIAVLSLNPHAGDDGLLGTEEEQIIKPAIAAARKKGTLAFGPYPADGFFGNGLFDRFDGVLAMYHDQGLAPFKTIAMERGVNFTAGLPFVRTSPDHGTAYDIAGRAQADPTSMREAIFMAIDVVRARKNYAAITANPLRKLFVEKGKDNVVLDLRSE